MCVLLFSFIRSILSLTPVSSRTNPDEFPHLASSWIKDVRISSGSQVLSWLYSVFWVCSHFDSSVCLVVLSSEPQQRRKKKKKTRAWGWHSSRGCKTRVFYWHHWAGSLQGGGGGWGALWSKPNMPRHMKRPGWPFPLRRLDAKAQATGRSQQRWAWLWEASLGAGERAGLGATLAPRLIFIHSLAPPCLISGHPERADIRTTWSEEKTTAHF